MNCKVSFVSEFSDSEDSMRDLLDQTTESVLTPRELSESLRQVEVEKPIREIE